MPEGIFGGNIVKTAAWCRWQFCRKQVLTSLLNLQPNCFETATQLICLKNLHRNCPAQWIRDLAIEHVLFHVDFVASSTPRRQFNFPHEVRAIAARLRLANSPSETYLRKCAHVMRPIASGQSI